MIITTKFTFLPSEGVPLKDFFENFNDNMEGIVENRLKNYYIKAQSNNYVITAALEAIREWFSDQEIQLIKIHRNIYDIVVEFPIEDNEEEYALDVMYNDGTLQNFHMTPKELVEYILANEIEQVVLL